MSELWQQHLRKLPGPVLADAWPIVDETGQGAKKTGPALTQWPAHDHSKFSTKHHFSYWMWDALNKCAIHQYNSAAAMNYLQSHISTPQTQQQIRKLLSSMETYDTLKSANVFDKLYHAVLITLPETTPFEMESRGQLSDLRPKAEETIIEYYVRFSAMASLVINAVDYGQFETEMSQAHLQLLFAETLTKAGRYINLGKLSNWLTDTTENRKHPREAASGYENLWSLVMANERLTAPQHVIPTSPPTIQAMQAVVPSTVSDLGKGRDEVTPQNKAESTALTTDGANLQMLIQTAVAQAVKQALENKPNNQPTKRVRTNDQVPKPNKARDERNARHSIDGSNSLDGTTYIYQTSQIIYTAC